MKSSIPTVDEFFERIWKTHWSQERFILSGHAKEVRRIYERNIKVRFGDRRISSIRAPEIRTWLRTFRDTPVAGNRTLEVMSKLLGAAVGEVLLESNPCLHVPSYTERKRARFATEQEILKIGVALERKKEKHRVGVCFIKTLLFTGARPKSLETALWSGLVRKDSFGILRQHGKATSSTGQDDCIVIPPQIMDEIEALPRRSDGKIFGIQSPRFLWEQIRKEVGCEDLWIRDLRRTFATIGMSNGVRMDVVGELLNHKSIQTTKIYAKLYDKVRIDSVGFIAEKIGSLLATTVDKTEREEAG